MPGSDPVHKISIIPRGIAALGYTLQRADGGSLPDDRRRAQESRSPCCSAGGPPRSSIYDEVSTGAHDDLSKATDIARSMIKTFGMSPRLGQVSFEKDRRHAMLQLVPDTATRNEYSEQTARIIDDEVRRIIDEQRERVADILSRRHKVLLRAGQVLMAKETISRRRAARDARHARERHRARVTGRCCAAGPVRAGRRARPSRGPAPSVVSVARVQQSTRSGPRQWSTRRQSPRPAPIVPVVIASSSSSQRDVRRRCSDGATSCTSAAFNHLAPLSARP